MNDRNQHKPKTPQAHAKNIKGRKKVGTQVCLKCHVATRGNREADERTTQ